MNRQAYPSDLTDGQWAQIAALRPAPCQTGRKRTIDRRELLNALFYRDKTGCQWRALPHDLPNWHTVESDYRRLRLAGVWARLHDILREQVRVKAGREPPPVPPSSTPKQSRRRKKGGPRLRRRHADHRAHAP